jgi:hypothetical protein
MAHVAFHHTFAGKRSLIAAAAVLALGIMGSASPALAQDAAGGAGAAGTQKKVTLNLENADLRYALKLLFNSVGVSYTLDQAATGVVTVALTDVPFRTALESILRAAGGDRKLTYRVEDAVYNITLKQEDTQTTTASTDPEPAVKTNNERIVKITLNFADAAAIAQAFGGGIITSQFSASVMGGFGGGFGQGGMGQGGMGGFGNGGGFGNNSSFGGGSFGSGFGNGMGGGGFNGGGMSGGFPGGNNRGGGGGGAPGGGARR